MKVNFLPTTSIVPIKLPLTEPMLTGDHVILSPGTNLSSAEETIFKEFTSAFEMNKASNKLAKPFSYLVLLI